MGKQTKKGKRNPVAKALRGGQCRPQRIPDKRNKLKLKAEKNDGN